MLSWREAVVPLGADKFEQIQSLFGDNPSVVDEMGSAIGVFHAYNDIGGLANASRAYFKWMAMPATLLRSLDGTERFTFGESWMHEIGSPLGPCFPKSPSGPGNFSPQQFLNGILPLPIFDTQLLRYLEAQKRLRAATKAVFPDDTIPQATAFKAAIAVGIMGQIDLRHMYWDFNDIVSAMASFGFAVWARRIEIPSGRSINVKEMFAVAAADATPTLDPNVLQHAALISSDNVVTRISRVAVTNRTGGETHFKYMIVNRDGPIAITGEDLAVLIAQKKYVIIPTLIPDAEKCRVVYKACFGDAAMAPPYVPSQVKLARTAIYGSAVAPGTTPAMALLNVKLPQSLKTVGDDARVLQSKATPKTDTKPDTAAASTPPITGKGEAGGAGRGRGRDTTGGAKGRGGHMGGHGRGGGHGGGGRGGGGAGTKSPGTHSGGDALPGGKPGGGIAPRAADGTSASASDSAGGKKKKWKKQRFSDSASAATSSMTSKTEPKPKKAASSSHKPIFCQKCGHIGHNAGACRTLGKNAFCQTCNAKGHYFSACPKTA